MGKISYEKVRAGRVKNIVYYTKKSISKPSRLLDKLSQKITVYAKFANTTYVYQFGCGILKMVGPKKQDFWPRINGSSKSAKIVLSKSIFDVKNQPNFFKKHFHLRISI